MKKHFLISLTSLILCFFTISCASTTTPSSNRVKLKSNTQSNQMSPQINTGFSGSKYGFSGIYLGMTYDSINGAVLTSPWIYKNCPSQRVTDKTIGDCHDAPQFLSENILVGDSTPEGREWLTFYSPNQDEKRGADYFYKNMGIHFNKGKVSKISLVSNPWAPGDIKTELVDWGMRMLKILIKSYGKPTVVYLPISQVDYFSFNPGFDTALYEWRIKKAKLTLTIGTDPQKNWFDCIVNFEAPASQSDTAAPSGKLPQKKTKPLPPESLAEKNSSAYPWIVKSKKNFNAGRYESCVINASRAIVIDSNLASVYALRAKAYLKLRQLGPALSDCNTAIKIDPNYAPIYNIRGRLYESVGKFKEAGIDYALSCDLGSKTGCSNYKKNSLKK